MAITLVGAGAQNAATTTPLTATLPSGVQADDLILLVIVSKGDRTITPDASYTLIENVLESSATNMRLVVSYKKAGASESNPSSSISTAASGWSVQTIVYRGVDTTTAQDATAVSSTKTTGATTWTPTGITTVTNNAVAVSIVGSGDNNTLHFLSGSEQGFAEQMAGGSYSTGQGSNHALGVGDKTIATAGAVTCPTWNQTVNGPDVWAGLTVALRPSSGSALTLTPNGDGTRSVVVNETGGTTNLYASVDDDPDTPTTSDWITTGENDGYVFLEVTSTPSDFGSMQTPLTVRAYLTSAGYGTDTCTVYAQVFKSDETTALTTEGTVGTQVSAGLVTADLTVNATGLAASKADWDAARLKVRWDYTP